MMTPLHPKRGQDSEGADSSPNAAKRACHKLRLNRCDVSDTITNENEQWDEDLELFDLLDGYEASDTITNENGQWDQDLEPFDLQMHGRDTVEVGFSSFDSDFDFSVLENPVLGSDTALAECLPVPIQPELRQDDESALVCYGAVCPLCGGLT